jgi:hypothetical protein
MPFCRTISSNTGPAPPREIVYVPLTESSPLRERS